MRPLVSALAFFLAGCAHTAPAKASASGVELDADELTVLETAIRTRDTTAEEARHKPQRDDDEKLVDECLSKRGAESVRISRMPDVIKVSFDYSDEARACTGPLLAKAQVFVFDAKSLQFLRFENVN